MSYWQTGMDGVGAAAMSAEKLSQKSTRTLSQAKFVTGEQALWSYRYIQCSLSKSLSLPWRQCLTL